VKINLVEVGPRDGLQSESALLPTASKLELIRRLVASGVRRLEVTSFVNPKKVPQMADAEALMAALPEVPGVAYIGLVLNRKGFDRARIAGCQEVGMAVIASDTFNRRNQGMSTEESVAAWLDIASAAHAAGIKPQVTISAAFGCPFEGEVDPERVIAIARRCAEGRPIEIAIADTVGVGVPSQVTDLFGRLRDALPDIPLRGHFHNTRNTGLANAYAAVMAGAQSLDASVGGTGGCPFAPAATGNIASEDLLYMLDRMGIETGVSIAGVIDTAKWLQVEIGRALPGMVMKAGNFPHPRGAASEAAAGTSA
jgi:hydroxymethylglutaryl-CoA lyase